VGVLQDLAGNVGGEDGEIEPKALFSVLAENDRLSVRFFARGAAGAPKVKAMGRSPIVSFHVRQHHLDEVIEMRGLAEESVYWW